MAERMSAVLMVAVASLLARATASATVGLAASFSIRPRRYACKDWPACAARIFMVLTASSETSLMVSAVMKQ